MSDVRESQAGGGASVDEEFPGSVGPTPTAEVGEAGSELNMSGGQRFWLASATLVGVLALIIGVTVLLRIGADENRGGGAGTAAPAGPVTELSVSGTEFAFDPADVTVAVGEEITVEFVNDGSVEHEWVVLTQGTQIASESEFDESLVLGRTDRIAGGTTTEATMTIDESGTYQIVCAVPGHIEAGMVGTLTAS